MSTLSLEEEEVSYIEKQKVLNGGKMFFEKLPLVTERATFNFISRYLGSIGTLDQAYTFSLFVGIPQQKGSRQFRSFIAHTARSIFPRHMSIVPYVFAGL